MGVNRFSILLLLLLLLPLAACSVWDGTDSDPDYLPLNDSEYPYAGLPRIVIETEDFREIRNTDTKIPAKLQIYGKSAPESEVLGLTVKGRGNSSFEGMPKYSMRLEFENKTALFGMPKDRDWTLIANSADRTFLKNYVSYKLFSWLGAPYSPRTQFVELYFNRTYFGVYLLTEKIKEGKHRVNLPEDGSAFLIGTDITYKENDLVYFARLCLPLSVHYPHTVQDSDALALVDFMNGWGDYLEAKKFPADNYFDRWIDIEAYLRYYWLQEFSRNHDSYGSSTYLTWEKGGVIQMGPVWDMDLAYGEPLSTLSPQGWKARHNTWNARLFTDSSFRRLSRQYWFDHHAQFTATMDSIPVYRDMLEKAMKNEFKRWPVLQNTENWTYPQAYGSYDEAVDSLQSWIRQRIDWIDESL